MGVCINKVATNSSGNRNSGRNGTPHLPDRNQHLSTTRQQQSTPMTRSCCTRIKGCLFPMWRTQLPTQPKVKVMLVPCATVDELSHKIESTN